MTIPSDPIHLGVVIPAAGTGERFGGRRKAFVELAGVPLLRHALSPFLTDSRVSSIVVALGPEDAADPPGWLGGLAPMVRVVEGGDSRTRSVHAALRALDPDTDLVLVHDAARPLATPEIVDRVVREAGKGVGAVAGWPVSDTIKRVGANQRVLETPDREELWAAQTPQAFPAEAFLAAYEAAVSADATATDDAAVFARFGGGSVRMVEGARSNLKVTYPEDLRIAELLLGDRDRSAAAEGPGTLGTMEPGTRVPR